MRSCGRRSPPGATLPTDRTTRSRLRVTPVGRVGSLALMRAGGRIGPLLGIAVLVLALVIPGLYLSADDTLYLAIDTSVLAGRGLAMPDGSPVLFRPPLYALMLLPGYALGGIDGAVFTNLVIGAACGAMLFALGRRVGGTGVGILAVLFGLGEASVLLIVHSLRIDVAVAASVLVVALLTIRLLERPRPWLAVAVGLALAAAVLLKFTALAIVPVPFIAAWWARGGGHRLERVEAALVAYLAFGAGLLPWWLWVWATTGRVYLLGDRGALPFLLLTLFATVGLIGLLAWLRRTRHRALVREMLAGWEGPGAMASTVVLAVGWGILFLALEFLSEGVQDPTGNLRANARYTRNELAPFLWPLGFALAGWVYALWRLRHRRPADLVAAGSLFAMLPVVAYVGLNWYDARSAMPLFLFSAVYEAALLVALVRGAWAWAIGDDDSPAGRALTAVLATFDRAASRLWWRAGRDRRASRSLRPSARPVAPALVAVFAAVLLLGVGLRLGEGSGLAGAESDEAVVVRAQYDWDNGAVTRTRDWLLAEVEPGSTVMISWLYGTELYRQTGGRFRMPYLPTVTLAVTSDGPLLVPTGTGRRFRDADIDAREAGADWLFIRKHPKGPYVGLTQTSLLDALRRERPDYLVLAGEHAAQSTATIAPYFDAQPAFTERTVIELPEQRVRIHIYEIAPDVPFVDDPSPPLSLDPNTLWSLLRDVPRARPGWTAAEVIDALGGQRVFVAQTDEGGRAAATELERLLRQ